MGNDGIGGEAEEAAEPRGFMAPAFRSATTAACAAAAFACFLLANAMLGSLYAKPLIEQVAPKRSCASSKME